MFGASQNPLPNAKKRRKVAVKSVKAENLKKVMAISMLLFSDRVY